MLSSTARHLSRTFPAVRGHFVVRQNVPFVQVASTLERIGALYAVEADVRGQPPDVRLNSRQARAAPLIADLRTAFNDALRRLSPKSVMAKAIVYGTKRWTALTRFLDDGRLEIDNNIAEHSLRGIAVGSRNWLLAGSHVGGE